MNREEKKRGAKEWYSTEYIQPDVLDLAAIHPTTPKKTIPDGQLI